MLEVPEALVLTCRQRILWANSAAERLFSLPVERLEGLPVGDIIGVPPKVLAQVCNLVTTTGYRIGYVQMLTGRGKRTARYRAMSVGGDSLHLIAFRPARSGQDTHHSSFPETAHASTKPKPDHIFDIAAGVAHEIRTPLATALMYLGAAGREIDAEFELGRFGAAVAAARAEILRIDQLVARMTEMQAFGVPVLRPRVTDLGAVVTNAVHRVMSEPSARSVAIETGGARFDDWWDDIAVGQIVDNLLSNAIKFGEGRPIDVALARVRNGARLSVRDRGIGLVPAERPALFQRRIRTPLTGANGLGLGLWLVRTLAEAHLGSVNVRSRPRRGSTFTVVLRPLRPQDRL